MKKYKIFLFIGAMILFLIIFILAGFKIHEIITSLFFTAGLGGSALWLNELKKNQDLVDKNKVAKKKIIERKKQNEKELDRIKSTIDKLENGKLGDSS